MAEEAQNLALKLYRMFVYFNCLPNDETDMDWCRFMTMAMPNWDRLSEEEKGKWKSVIGDISDKEVADWNEMWDDIDFSIWDEYPTIRLSTPWFTAFRLPGNVIAIYEPLHNQRVSAFLILGEDKALLWDTCIGFQNLREVVDELTDLPISVLNSHSHFDHIGGNSGFDEVWCYNIPTAIENLTNAPDEIILNEVYNREKSYYPIIKVLGLIPSESIQRKAPTGTVEDGQIIDIGGRKLEVIYTPGHDISCIMLLDRENKLLFTGDMFYYGYMYCSTDTASLQDYVQNIRKAADIASENRIENLYVSHDKCVVNTENLYQFADWLSKLEDGENTEYKQAFGVRVYYMKDKVCIELPDNDLGSEQKDTTITEIPDKDPGGEQYDTTITDMPNKDPDGKQNNTAIIIVISSVLAVMCVAIILIVRKNHNT